MKLPIKKVVETEAKFLDMHMKVRDTFSARLLDGESQILADYEGYVPKFMPPDHDGSPHFGDYLILRIDLDTGQIVNWPKKVSPAEVMATFFPTEEEE